MHHRVFCLFVFFIIKDICWTIIPNIEAGVSAQIYPCPILCIAIIFMLLLQMMASSAEGVRESNGLGCFTSAN